MTTQTTKTVISLSTGSRPLDDALGWVIAAALVLAWLGVLRLADWWRARR